MAWRALALLFVGLGLIGALVPGLPTTVFLLLGAWASGHGWPALNRWLLTHPKFGPSINQWQQHRAVPRRAKYAAATMMSISALLICFSGMLVWAKLLLIAVMLSVLLWLCLRPEVGDDARRSH
ncbi:YbaN family protein [Gilvimarinus agarilyticus]|uniref:YbaN family protein n=1 Tax=Gilvimarinus agarilyticus TaxID=679259 RepID=UPI0005A15DCC|nr:YbaN family protein [Gilvimarinus agarilyticus]